MHQFHIKIHLKSFECSTLQSAKTKIEDLYSLILMSIEREECERSSIENLKNHTLFSYAPLPSSRKRLTVLRSPHIDKKSREQFQWQVYRGQIRLISSDKRIPSLLLFLLKTSEFPGIQLAVASNCPAPFYY